MTAEELSPSEFETIARYAPLLADPAVWLVAHPSHEDAVVAAISPRATGQSSRRWVGRGVAALMGAAAAATLTLVVTRDHVDSPDATLSLVGSDLAPSVRGEATLRQQTSGLEIEVHMPGLPRRDGGAYYQLWMHRCDGTEWVPAGTFHDMEYIRAWAGVPAADYPVLEVTQEHARSADQAVSGPAGAVVATGSLATCST